MTKVFLILSLLAISSMAIPLNYEELTTLWSSWKNLHNKNYAHAEEAARFAIFVENYKRIIDFNSKNTQVKQGLNKFADLTGEEFKNLYANCHQQDTSAIRDQTFSLLNNSQYQLFTDLPSSVDWRKKGAVGPVENQGSCGSCWAFSAVEALEGLYFIDDGELLEFSVQQIVDCDTESSGCNGGLMSRAFAYTAKYGIETEKDYPYQGDDGTCKYDKEKAIKVNSGFKWVPFRDVNALKTALVNQPVSISIEADQDAFQFYTSGVISSGCGTNTDHGVLAVGYDTFNGKEAFIVKNSWGADWGQEGYVYISTDGSANDGNGVCGIFTGPVVPVK